jgi:hypothetical protein
MLEIREMAVLDVSRAADAILHGGWGDRTAFLRFAVAEPSCTPYAEEHAGAVVATGPAVARATAPRASGIRAFEPSDVGAALGLDRAATGEERRPLLEASNGSGLVAETADRGLRGHLAEPFGQCAVIARDTPTALALLETRRATAPGGAMVRVGLPESNWRPDDPSCGGLDRGARRLALGPRPASGLEPRSHLGRLQRRHRVRS